MKYTIKFLGIIALIVIIGFGLSACGGGSGGNCNHNKNVEWIDGDDEYCMVPFCEDCQKYIYDDWYTATTERRKHTLQDEIVQAATAANDGSETISKKCVNDGCNYYGNATYSTSGLSYTLINNNTAYRVSKQTGGGYYDPNFPLTFPTRYEGKQVTEIGDFSKEKVSKVLFHDGINKISNNAFSECTFLTEITIPAGITSIGDAAFSYCKNLESITIQNEIIGNVMFAFCTGLTEITIPDSVTSIGERAFYDCTGLTEITIPASVTSIGYKAFTDCSGLESITIQNKIIGDEMFSHCFSLTEITIPDSVTSIGSGAFSWTSLEKIIIGNSVQTIGDGAFSFCSSLTEITIPDSVTSIGNWVFRDCFNLEKIIIGSSVQTIGDYAFRNCYILTEITIPASVKSIGDRAFDRCSLILITLKRWDSTLSGNDRITTIGSNPFGYRTEPPLIPIEPNTDLRIVVPKGSLLAYQEGNYWNDSFLKLADRIEEENDE
ncbi:MAG: leucine-rich repeat domain-containing protein [Treponema sp.]|nr:leucine-rich repeat domain-containing protein [Treponema sp.]MCL2251936.1 leucine-rich repeat domain-containing protein [Treponema sp.]